MIRKQVSVLYEYCERMKTLISWRMHSLIFGNSASGQAVRTSVWLWCQNWDFMSDISYINPSKWIRVAFRIERCIVPSYYRNTDHIYSYLYTQRSREWFCMHFSKFCLRFTNIGSLDSHFEKVAFVFHYLIQHTKSPQHNAWWENWAVFDSSTLSPVLDVTIKWCLHSKAANWFVKYIAMKYFYVMWCYVIHWLDFSCNFT